ncbi:hypothetical protein ACFQH6_14800 [Halobacteriaceae archaeon GCM10025711]
MAGLRTFLADPWTIRTVLSIVAGAVTALIVVRTTFFLHGQRDLFKATRAIVSELEHDAEKLARLSRLLQDDMRRQQVDLPVEVPAGTTMEIRYVLSLPGSLNTTAFDQLRQSGRLEALSPEMRQELFDLYDAIDRINRLREHRESLHYNNVENVHVVIDPSELDVEPGTTVTEGDLPPPVRDRLDALRQLRRATRGINTSILRLVAAVSSPAMVADLELEEFAESNPARAPDGTNPTAAERDVPTIQEMIAKLEAVERASFWSRFV